MPDSAGDLRRKRGKAQPVSPARLQLPRQIPENLSDRTPGGAMMSLS
jgi:hypothetical protein